MAERRMMSKKVTDDDNFMALSSSAQALYLHLSMNADDDGFCNQVSISMFKAHASVQDLQSLLENRYIYQFESGVIVIKHWRMCNALRKDRYTPTVFQEELSKLRLENNGCYERLPDGCQMVASCLPQDRLGKDSIDNNIYIVEQSPTADVQVPVVDCSGRTEVAVQVPAPVKRQKSEAAVQVPASNDTKYPYKEIIDYLNLKTGKQFSNKAKDARRHIHARIEDGYTVDDFKKVIDIKAAEWKDDPGMNKFLRPSTLFGNKFESYLNQKVFAKKQQKKNKFNNFDSRNYDMSSLEARLLNSQMGGNSR